MLPGDVLKNIEGISHKHLLCPPLSYARMQPCMSLRWQRDQHSHCSPRLLNCAATFVPLPLPRLTRLYGYAAVHVAGLGDARRRWARFMHACM